MPVTTSAGLSVLLLTLSLSQGVTSVVPAAPDDGGPRDWQVVGVARSVNAREQPSTTARVVATFPLGSILDNLGCQQAADGVWCDVQPLGGGPRGYVALRYLKGAVSPNGAVSTGPDDSAARAGEGKFDATGTVPCARAQGQPTAECKFGVARAGGGYATVVVTLPDGRRRTIYFRMGRAIGVESSQADRAGVFKATRKGYLTLISVGTERYEISDAVVLGG